MLHCYDKFITTLTQHNKWRTNRNGVLTSEGEKSGLNAVPTFYITKQTYSPKKKKQTYSPTT